jgi:hypothetical protein
MHRPQSAQSTAQGARAQSGDDYRANAASRHRHAGMTRIPRAAHAGLALLASISLAACAATAGDPPSHRVSVEGRTYLISQLTAGTWTATAPGAAKEVAGSPTGRAALLQAIEQRSGCKVTDSDYSRNGMQLDAQVDCASRLKN